MAWKPIKCPLLWEFLVTFCYTVLFFMIVNIKIWPLDRPIVAEFAKEFSMKTSLIKMHPLFVSKSHNNDYFTNYSTYNRPVSSNDHQNSKTNCLIKN